MNSRDTAMMNNPKIKAELESPGTTTTFSLSDPETLVAMLQIALDLDLTFACHGRRGQLEFCFESNRTAERSGGR